MQRLLPILFAAILCTRSLQAKTLVLVICSEDLPVYKGFIKSWRSYMHLDPENFECYFIRNDPHLSSDYLIENDVIWCRGEENFIPGLLNKTLKSLEVLRPRFDEFEFVLRANLSSFFIFPRLLQFLETVPRQNLYCGIHHALGISWFPPGWVCGAGIILSMDLVENLLDHKVRLLDFCCPTCNDDLVIARYLHSIGIPITRGRYAEIDSEQDWFNLASNMSSDIFHVKMHTQDRAQELIIHKTLLEHFYGKTVDFEDCK